MAKKYYAVVRGKEGSGIYLDWPRTEENVKGISGVKYKSFPDEGSAREFIMAQGIPGESIQLLQSPDQYDKQAAVSSSKTPAAGRKVAPSHSEAKAGFFDPRKREESILSEGIKPGGSLTAYVDGSFRQGYSVYGYGVVIVTGGDILETFSGFGSRPEYVSMRNVAGEVLGAVKAMEYAMAKGASELILHFDYQGIESWATGTWKRNNDLTRGYHQYVRDAGKHLKIRFRKVKGHSGDRFNDLADELAKAAVVSSTKE